MQTLTVKIRIIPTDDEINTFRQLSLEYIRVVNTLVGQSYEDGSFPKITTKHVDADLPSAVLNQAIRDAKSVYRKSTKHGTVVALRKPTYYVNNQNYTVTDDSVAFLL